MDLVNVKNQLVYLSSKPFVDTRELLPVLMEVVDELSEGARSLRELESQYNQLLALFEKAEESRVHMVNKLDALYG